MSHALRSSIERNIDDLASINHTIKSSDYDLGFEQEQLSYQMEGLVFELKESVEAAIKLASLDED